MTASPDAARTSKAAAVALLAAGVVLLGGALPIDHGWGLPVFVIVVLTAVSVWRDAGGAYRNDEVRGPGRVGALLLVGLAACVLVAVATGVAASITIAFPGSVWAVPVVILGTVAAGWAGPRARLPVAVAMALLVPAAGVIGARFEAAGPHAHGWAHSGPIHGIHPFQMTAVRVDGFGPFDIPINDYVEPEGTRGYSPETYADALERALHSIAEVHFRDGPARARHAFAEARVRALRLPAVEETLGVSPGAEEQPRIEVRSGGWGQRSRVEFMCPGKHDEAGGPRPDDLMDRMCPNKYAAEGSAGLGVTGRWPGYAEGRGQPRVGLAPARGLPRTSDAIGAQVLRAERLFGVVAWIALGVVALLFAPSRKLMVRGASRMTAALALGGLSAALVLAFEVPAGVGRVAFIETPVSTPAWTAWLPAMLLLAGMPEIRARAGIAGSSWVSITVLAATGTTAAAVARLAWIDPVTFGDQDFAPLERWIVGAADTLARARGMGVFETEHGIAAMLVAVLVGAAWAILSRAASSIGTHAPPQIPPAWRTPLAGVLIAIGAIAFAISRKTFGGATLVPGAIGLTVVLHSGLAWARHRTPWRGVFLVGAVLGTAWLWVHAIDLASAPEHAWPKIYASMGVLAAFSGLAFFAPRRA